MISSDKSRLIKSVSVFCLLILCAFPGNADAQYFFFGRNKVQYEDFNWKMIGTENFNIYYYGDFENIAEIGAKFAQDSFDDLKQKFNHYVTRKIPLIFYNTHIHFQQTNTRPGFIPEGVGGFFEFFKGRVVIPYQGSLEQFEHVIKHEMVHVFMIDKIYNMKTNHRSAELNMPPLWFVEGLAEYWSYYWDAQAEMVLRDVVLSNLFSKYSDMDKIYGSFIMYKAGQNFLKYLSDEYGESKILLLLENSWRFSNFNDVLEFTLEESIEHIDRKYEYYLKRKYYPLIGEKFPHKIASKKLTNEGFNFSPCYYSDGEKEWLIFIANRSGYSSIYKLEINDKSKDFIEPLLLIQGEREEIFESFHLMKPSIDVSANGEIVFVTKSGASDVIHLYSISNKEITKTFRFDEIISIEGTKFSKDRSQIVFSAIDKKGFSDIFIVNVESGKLTRLTNDYYYDKEPVFSNDGNYVVFASDRTEGRYEKKINLFKYDLSDHLINYLTYTDANIASPRFNSEGELFFTTDYEDVLNLWKLEWDENLEPRGMIKISNFLTSVFEYTFRDDKRIITSAIENFSFQFYEYEINNFANIENNSAVFDFTDIGHRWFAEKVKSSQVLKKIDYETEYTLDYAVSQVIADPVFGARGGAIFTLSDMLSDDQFMFLLYNTAEDQTEIMKNFNVAITRINTKYRTNYAYGIFHFNGRRYDIRESNEYFVERSFGGFFSLIFPFSTFQRIEASISTANSDKKLLGETSPRKALLMTNTLSFVHDNTLWGPTGPLDGSRFRLLLGYTSDVKFSNVNYYSLIADYRNYLRLGFRTALASRASFYYNHGKEARRYFAGGSWDLRGWKRFSIRGEKLWISSVELRFPLIDRIAVDFPFLGIGLFNIRGAAYFDIGSAWDDEYFETLGSFGAGVRINILNAITLRYDVGKRIEKGFTHIQDGLFYQFFFGWDF